MSDARDDTPENVIPFPPTERRRMAFACTNCHGVNWQLIMVDDVVRFEPDIKLDEDAADEILFEPASDQTQSIECSACGFSLTLMNEILMVPSDDAS